MLQATYAIPGLPPEADLETRAILKALGTAHRHLGELKGRAPVIPNQGILIDTLALQEAKASSEIENIVTTQDEMYRADIFPGGPQSGAAKEVARYRDALHLGFSALTRSGGLITSNTLIDIFQLLKQRSSGFRMVGGTTLRNDQTGNTIYVPPQSGEDIRRAMAELETFINAPSEGALDPLVKMALIHHQFESIHPFPDGNGRIGRILNVLYLTQQGLLDIPILYLSRHINATKDEYYRLLQAVRDDGAWEDWVLYMLEAVSSTARTTLVLVNGIRELMQAYKRRMKAEFPRLYSQDLLNNIFRHPYTRIEFLQSDLAVTRQTASRYLEQLSDAGLLLAHKAGRAKYFINAPLVDLFVEANESGKDSSYRS